MCSQSSSNSSQVTAGSGKALESEAPHKRGSASFVSSLLKSSMNSHMTQSTDNRQQSGSPKKGALEGSSGSASQSSSEIEVPLLGSSGSAEVELPLLSCKSSSETASSGLTSKSSSEANISSSVSKKQFIVRQLFTNPPEQFHKSIAADIQKHGSGSCFTASDQKWRFLRKRVSASCQEWFSE